MAHAWDNASYPKRAQALVQSANIDANLAHCPTLLVITDANAIAKADIASKRYQIYDHNGTEMPYAERVYTEGATYLNAKIFVAGSSTTLYASPTGDQNKFWIYYGDYDPGSDQDDPTNVWDSYYKGVWPMDEASGHLIDETSNSNDSTVESNLTYGQTGKIGNAVDFNGSSSYATIPHSADWAMAADFTIECWADTDLTDYYGMLIYHYDAGTKDGFALWQYTTGSGQWRLRVWVSDVSATPASNAAPTTDYTHLAATRVSGTLTLYVNGVAQTVTASLSGAIDSSGVLAFGRHNNDASRYFNGRMGESRISNGVGRSVAWLKFQVANVHESDHEQTWSAEEDKPAGGIVILRRRREAA